MSAPTNPNTTEQDAPDSIPVALPTNPQGEAHLLSSLLGHGKQVADLVLPLLKSRDFYYPQNRVIFEAIQQCHGEGRDVAPESVAEVLSRLSGRLEGCGGIENLSRLATDPPAPRGAMPNAQALQLYTERRAIIAAMQQGAQLAADPLTDMNAVRAKTVALAQSAVNLSSLDARTERAAQMAPRLLKEIRERRARGTEILGVSSGLRSWDLTLSGLIPGRLNLMAGRPGMGKTAAMLSVALNTARMGVATIIFSLEMDRDELWYRALSQLSGVNSQRIATGNYSDAEDKSIEQASDTLSRIPLSMNDATDITPRRLESVLRRFVASTPTKGAPVMMIDYAQLIGADDAGKNDNDAKVIKTNVYEIKDILRNQNVANITLAQLNRNVEKREDKRPISSDLEGSGGLEQAADSITFLYRPTYYQQQALLEAGKGETGAAAEKAEADKIFEDLTTHLPPDEAEWIVAKVRGGVPRRLKMTFHPTRTLFTNGGIEMRGF